MLDIEKQQYMCLGGTVDLGFVFLGVVLKKTK